MFSASVSTIIIQLELKQPIKHRYGYGTKIRRHNTGIAIRQTLKKRTRGYDDKNMHVFMNVIYNAHKNL